MIDRLTEENQQKIKIINELKRKNEQLSIKSQGLNDHSIAL